MENIPHFITDHSDIIHMKALLLSGRGRCLMLLVLAVSVLAACSEEGVSFDATTEGPKNSLTFLTQHFYDSADIAIKLPRDTASFRVATSRPAYEGRAVVVPFIKGFNDSTFVHYGTNGDISIYDEGTSLAFIFTGVGNVKVPGAWVTFPLGSKVDINQTLLDTTLNPLSATPKRIKATIIQEFLGPDIVPTTSGPLNAVKAISVRRYTLDEGNKHYESSVYLTMWYSPKLGSFVAADSVHMKDDSRGLRKTAHNGWAIKQYNGLQ